MKLIIPFPLPGLNEYIAAERTHRQKAAKMKREWMGAVSLVIRRQLRRPLREPVWMDYLWVERSRRRDKDNICGYGRKIIQDALVQTGALKNDGWSNIDGFSDRFAVGDPRIEIDIQEAEE